MSTNNSPSFSSGTDDGQLGGQPASSYFRSDAPDDHDAGTASSGAGTDTNITAQSAAASSNANGANIDLTPGAGDGSGSDGRLRVIDPGDANDRIERYVDSGFAFDNLNSLSGYVLASGGGNIFSANASYIHGGAAGARDLGASGIRWGAAYTEEVALYTLGSDPSPITDFAHIFAKDVSTLAEVHAMDEGGTVTQISPHPTDGPDAVYTLGRGLDVVYKSIHYPRGVVIWSPLNGQAQLESFAAFNARLAYTPDDKGYLVPWGEDRRADPATWTKTIEQRWDANQQRIQQKYNQRRADTVATRENVLARARAHREAIIAENKQRIAAGQVPEPVPAMPSIQNLDAVLPVPPERDRKACPDHLKG